MSADQLLKTIIDKKIQVVPVLDNKENIEYWSVGFRKYYKGGGTNYVPNHMVARGKTLEEAVDKLLGGKTLYKISDCGTGLVECLENQ